MNLASIMALVQVQWYVSSSACCHTDFAFYLFFFILFWCGVLFLGFGLGALTGLQEGKVLRMGDHW